MRKLFLKGSLLLLMGACFSCHGFHHRGDVSVTISEHDGHYKMSSYFNRKKTREVQDYMTQQIGRQNDISFANTTLDAVLTIDDKTTFYIKSMPGEVEIDFDKSRNSDEGFQQVKAMCEGIKDIVAKQ
jgi:hypothetical protein